MVSYVKLKSIGVRGSVLSICREFLSNRGQRVVLLMSGCQSFLTFHSLGPLLFTLYTSEMFELVENRLYAYDDDSTLLAVSAAKASKQSV